MRALRASRTTRASRRSASCRASPARRASRCSTRSSPTRCAATATSSSSLGSGEGRFERMFDGLARAFPRQVGFYNGFSNELAHLDRGRLRHVPDAVALRAVRPQPDVQPALRHRADRPQDRRPRRHRAAVGSARRDAAPASRSSTTTPPGCAGRSRPRSPPIKRPDAVARAACTTAWPRDFSWDVQGKLYEQLYTRLAAQRRRTIVHVVFIEPRFPGEPEQFVRALAEIGATRHARSARAARTRSTTSCKRWLTHYEQVKQRHRRAARCSTRVRFIQRQAHVDRLEAVGRGAHHADRARARGGRHPRHDACGPRSCAATSRR